MRLIDADALIEIISTMQGLCDTKDALTQNAKIWQQVKDMPTVDAVPVIRCEDCRHSAVVATLEHNDGTVEKYYMCKLLREGTDADGFCHRGKRKEQTEDDTDECCDADEEE